MRAQLVVAFSQQLLGFTAGSTYCTMNVTRNTKCSLGAYAKSAAASADACCAICQQEAQCVQWTFHADKTINCDRVNVMAPKQELSGAVCGLNKRLPPVPPVDLNFSWAVLPTWVKLSLSTTNASHTAFAAKNFELVQATMHHGDYVEADNIALCRQAKEASPSTACLFYWNTDKIRNASVTAQYMIQAKPQWLLQDDKGRFAEALHGHLCPDYRNAKAADYYLSACLDATRSGFVDGCALDSAQDFNEVDTSMLTTDYKFTKAEQQQYVSGKRGALQRLQQHAEGKAMFAHCNTCLGDASRHQGGHMVSGHTCGGMSGQATQKFDATQDWVDALRLLASEGKGLLLCTCSGSLRVCFF